MLILTEFVVNYLFGGMCARCDGQSRVVYVKNAAWGVADTIVGMFSGDFDLL